MKCLLCSLYLSLPDIPLRKNLQLRNEANELLPETETIFSCAVRNSDTLYLTIMDNEEGTSTSSHNSGTLHTKKSRTACKITVVCSPGTKTKNAGQLEIMMKSSSKQS